MGKAYSTREYEPKTCRMCGAVFTPHHWRMSFCSADCQRIYEQRKYRKKYQKKAYKLVCKACGKEFITSYPNALYCSEECRGYKPKKEKEPKKNRHFVYAGSLCPNPSCSWRIDCGGGKSVCARAKCQHIA